MLIAKNIYKYYGKDNSAFAIEDLNIAFEDKGMVFLCGDSGSGKSTLLNILSSMEKADSGSLYYENVEITSLNDFQLSEYRKNEIGFIFQNYNLFEEMTVLENITSQLLIQKNKYNSDLLNDVLHKTGLFDIKDFKVSKISGGQKQRVGIARALVKNPHILFCDEPTGALDSRTSTEIFDLLKMISKDVLVIIASHDMQSVKKYADRIITISDGCITGDTKSVDVNLIEKSKVVLNRKFKPIPSKEVGHFAFLNFFKKPSSLIAACLLSFISLSLVGTSLSFTKNEKEEIVAKAITESKFNYVKVEKKIKYISENNSGVKDERIKLSEKEINEISNNSLDSYCLPSFRYFRFLPFANKKDFGTDYVYNSEIGGMCEINANIAKSFNLELVEGSLPYLDDEIVITTYQFERFVNMGLVSGGVDYEINKYTDIIGKEIELTRLISKDSYNFKIVGIIDTGISKKFKENIEEDYKTDFDNNCLNGLDRCIFSTKNTISKLKINNYDYFEFDILSKNGLFCNENFEAIIVGDINHAENPTFFDTFDESSLNNRSCLLSFDYFNHSGEISSPANSALLSLFQRYSPWIETINPLKSSAKLKDFYDYFKSYSFNPSTMDYSEFKVELGKEIQKYLNKNNINSVLLDSVSTSGFSIVGFFEHMKDEWRGSSIVLNKEVISEILNSNSQYFDCDSVYVQLSSNIENNKNALFQYKNYTSEELANYHSNYLKMNGSKLFIGFTYETSNIYFGLYNQYSFMINLLDNFAFILGTILGLFSILFMFLFFNGQANKKEKEIAILRTLGASKLDIFRIFLLQNIFIAMFNCALGFGGAVACISILRNIPKLFYVSALNIVGYSFMAFVLLAIISFVICILAMLIPFLKTIRKSPINVLKCEE